MQQKFPFGVEVMAVILRHTDSHNEVNFFLPGLIFIWFITGMMKFPPLLPGMTQSNTLKRQTLPSGLHLKIL
jgi:hypothetical protein